MTLSDKVRQVLIQASEVYADQPRAVDVLRRQLARLDEPLRVAIAGKVKAGKSTLLNALVGEAIAATDAGECTKVVTWYRNGPSPRIVAYPVNGAPAPLPVLRRAGALIIELGSRPAESLDRLVVDWPTRTLRTSTLIDTPGVASINQDVSARTARFLDPDDDTPTEADAVIYLMRHLHVNDVEFLEAFRDQGVARATAVNTVAVLSRADEIGAGRLDAMFSARAIATRYRSESSLHGLCQNVVAVAGLLAYARRTLRNNDYAALTDLARRPKASLDADLLSADRLAARRLRGAIGALRPVRHPARHDTDSPGRRQPDHAGRGAGGPQRTRRAATHPRRPVRITQRSTQGPLRPARPGRARPCRRRRPRHRPPDRTSPCQRPRVQRATPPRPAAVRHDRPPRPRRSRAPAGRRRHHPQRPPRPARHRTPRPATRRLRGSPA
jgi:hypothetical protein